MSNFNSVSVYQNINYFPPKLSEYNKDSIHIYAEYVAEKLHHQPGDDLFEIVKSLGGEIKLSIPEGDGKSSSIIVHGPQDFQIFLSNYTSKFRDRFTIAHALGHYFLHSMQGDIKIHVQRYGSNEIEWQANWFAASFLMPKGI